MSSSNSNIQSAVFPNLPRDPKVIDENGEFTALWALYFQQMNQALQRNFTPTGFVMPQQSTAYFANPVTAAYNGYILYDSGSNLFKGNENGIWKTFTLT